MNGPLRPESRPAVAVSPPPVVWQAPVLAMSPAAIRAFCEQNHIRRMSLFGSILSPDFRPDSDIDMLVEFEPEVRVTLFDMAAMAEDLTGRMGRRVDLRTPGDLSRYFRDAVLASAQVQYERP